jgi:3-hydroxyacyl-CoA dehydrogenase, NAD binding domain
MVAVVGAGAIGLSWTSLFLAHGYEVWVTDPRPDLEAFNRRRRMLPAMLPASAAAVVLAACGSSGGSSGGSGGAYGPAGSGPPDGSAPAAGGATLTARPTSVGSILTHGAGFTPYAFEADRGNGAAP